ncbi:MAG: hypothetical protein F6J90_42070 [Moorea sp. SIOASIH]|uniref:hypothetical protein n=1 Tax=Moorena sp. SIOASIH TaxID=2607817 RepID=UPI0013B9A516|nr:hypothetical protein [Moorena sp. SIOASIH]NEO42557.1 hypothetical protein [Moorena sp. SIOASIH]
MPVPCWLSYGKAIDLWSIACLILPYGGLHNYQVHRIVFPLASCLLPLASCLLPLAFPSWEGLGVGSSCLLPLHCSLLPAPCSLKTQDFVPNRIENRFMHTFVFLSIHKS